MISKKVVIPLVVFSVGIGSYLYFGSVDDTNNNELTQHIQVVEAEQLNADGSSRTLDLLKEKAEARDQEGKVVKLNDMSDEMKHITGRLRIMQTELSDYLEESVEEEKVFQGEDAVLDAQLAKLDLELEKINAKEGIDGESIKAEIIAMIDAPVNDEDIPEELAKSLNETDEILLELEESMDKMKENI